MGRGGSGDSGCGVGANGSWWTRRVCWKTVAFKEDDRLASEMIGGYQATPPSHKQQKAMMTTCRWGHPWAFAWSPLFYITTSACLSSCSLFAASKLAAATTDFGEKRREQSQQARTALLSQKLCRSQGASRRQQAESIGDSSELFAVCSDLFPHTNVTNVSMIIGLRKGGKSLKFKNLKIKYTRARRWHVTLL